MADAGRAMMLYKGVYDSTYTYEKLDVVNYNGSLYISTVDGNLGIEPTNEAKWKLFLQGGIDGKGNVIEETYVPNDAVLKTLEEIEANTFSENIAGALALKEVNSKLKSFGSTFSITTQGVIDCFELTKTDVYLCVTFTVAPSPTQANLYIAIGGHSGSLLFKVTENPDNIKLQLADNMLQLVSVYGNAGYVEIINFRHWK